MKAYVLHAVNDLHYDEINIPECPKGWAIIKVKAAGICSSDIARVFTKGTYHFPTIPGHEFSGEVYSVGDEKDAVFVGKKVGVFPLIPCRECPQCAEKHYEMCANYDYVGSRRDGGYAEYVAVPIWNLLELPETISFTSAAMLEPLSVALHAIKIGGVKKNDNVAIIGTGMIGISTGQWAYKFGARKVTVIGRNETKRELVEKCGLEYAICSNKDEISQYDFVLEAVGTPSAVEMAVSGAIPGGTVLLMGNPSGDINFSQDLYWRILRKQLVLKGTWNSAYDGTNSSDWTEAVAAIANNEINVEPLISHVFKQDNLMDGLKLMQEHAEPYCKVMTTWNN
ncbi:galactitol-1-phosphate 5-dehydrogenase [Bacteroides bouchesdurhonensis]|uniref:galactitol-1-phosphate 5-dehydrogenase n=1 Tax=Bacteroides bouchesdurhonensis TaxID=1841855 RepID=UPI0022E6A892|nr:galactitol-1-phosphate 5-dehydrogenase [Bacteroides bouchesdurhonensis]